MRTDIFKIATYQRPVPQTCRDLGEWEACLWFQTYAAVLQVSLFTAFSTQTLELVFFTDPTDPCAREPGARPQPGARPHAIDLSPARRYYYVDRKLTVPVKLASAFAFSAFLAIAISLIRASLSELPQDVVAMHERDKVNASRSVARESSRSRARAEQR